MTPVLAPMAQRVGQQRFAVPFALGATFALLAAVALPAAAQPTPQTVYVDFSGIDARGDLTAQQKADLKNKIKEKLKKNLESAVGAGNVDVTDDAAKKAGAARKVEFKDSMGGGAWGDWAAGSDTANVYVQEFMDDPNVDDAFQTDGKWDLDKLANALERTAAHELGHSFSVGHNDDTGADEDKMTDGGGVTAEERATKDWHYDEHSKKTIQENWNKKPCAAAVDYDHKALLTDVWGADMLPWKPDDLFDIDTLFSFSGRMASQFHFGWLGRDPNGALPGDPDFDLLRGFVYKSSLDGRGADAEMITFLQHHHDYTQFALMGAPGSPWQGKVFPLAEDSLQLSDLVQQPDGDLVARTIAMSWDLDGIPGADVMVSLDAHAWGPQTNPYNGFKYDLPARRPPVAVVAPVAPAECDGGGAVVTLDGSRSYDLDFEQLSFLWSAPGVTFDDPASPTPTARFPLGTTQVTLTLRDGIFHSQASARVVVVDTIPPVTSAALSGTPGSNGWWRSAVEATLSATDRCGVDQTFAALDGREPAPRRNLTVAGDGRHEVRYYSTDLGGNLETPRLLPVDIDTTPPLVSIADPAPGALYLQNNRVRLGVPNPPPPVVVGTMTVKADIADATSGVASAHLYVDGKLRASDSSAPYEFVWEAGKEKLGEHELEVRASDVAGNQASAKARATTVPTTPEGLRATAGP